MQPAIPIQALPRIQKLLNVEGKPYFAILPYAAFVKLAASGGDPPDITCVLDAAGEHEFVILPLADLRAYLRRLHITGTVDEDRYLDKYPDVKAALGRNGLLSGTQHFLEQGYFEGRDAHFLEAVLASGTDRSP